MCIVSAFVDVRTSGTVSKAVAGVTTVAAAGIRSVGVGAGGICVAKHFDDGTDCFNGAFINVDAASSRNYSITGPTKLTGTSVGTVGVDTVCIGITVVCFSAAFVDIGTTDTIAFVTNVATTFERAICVDTASIDVAVVKGVTESGDAAFVKVGTGLAISFPAEVTVAGEAAVCVATCRVDVAVVSSVGALVMINATLAVATEAGIASARE